MPAGAGQQLSLEPAAGVVLAEALAGDEDAAHPDLGAVLDGLQRRLGSQGDHREIHRDGEVGDLRVRTAPPHLEGVPRDDVHGAVVAGVLERPQDPATRGIVAGGDTDQQDRGGVQHPLHRLGLDPVLALGHHRQGALGGVDLEVDQHHAVVQDAPHVEACVGEHVDHPRVLRQHLRGEGADAALAGGGGQVLQQHRSQPRALPVIGHHERDLGGVLLGAVVAGDADDRLPHHGHQRHPVPVVHDGETAQVPGGQRRHGGEEAHVQGALGLALVEALQGVGVLRPDRSHVRGRAVPQGDVRFPVHRIGRGRRGRGGGAAEPGAQCVASGRPFHHVPILAVPVWGLTGFTGPPARADAGGAGDAT